MKIGVRSLVLGLLAFGTGCGEDGPPSCTDVDWYPAAGPYLTAPPTFTASRIVAGDPVSLAVSVSDDTSTLSAGIRLVDDPNSDRYPHIQLQADTGGQDVVALSITTDGLVPGTYLATSIWVEDDSGSSFGPAFPYGNYVLLSHRSPSADDVETAYIATYYFGGDGYARSCRTDLLAPAFEVVEESPSSAQSAFTFSGHD